MSRQVSTFVAVLFTLLILVSSSVQAHNYLPAPGKEGEATRIPEISLSRAAYRELKASGQKDIYAFEAKAGDRIYIQMTVPDIPRYAKFAPSFILETEGGSFGEIPAGAVKDGEIEALFAEDGDVHGLRVSYAGDFEGRFYEPVTGTNYRIRQTLALDAPADGEYGIIVAASDGGAGKYILATGEKEAFGIFDILGLPAVWYEVRTFMEEDVVLGIVTGSILGAAAVGGIAWGIVSLIWR